MLRLHSLALALGLICPAGLPGAAAAPQGKSSPSAGRSSFYASRIDALIRLAASDASVQKQVDAIIKKARDTTALPLVQRAGSLKELQNPERKRIGDIDARTWNVQKKDPRKAEIFALAMSDLSTCGLVVRELPLLAAAYRLTHDQIFLDRIVAQLREMVAWDPLQRHGWELYTADHNLPPDGNDGVWLATGDGLIAIGQTLDLLPAGSLPTDLRAQIQKQLEREIGYIVHDWTHAVPWFVREESVGCNQYVVPSAGLVVACVAAGRAEHEGAYELGVANLTKTLAALGEDGSASEGFTYALDWTAPFLNMAAIAAADTGDQRLASAPFLKHFPLWLAQCFQPGENVITCFDNYGGARGLYPTKVETITRMAGLTGSPYLAWLLRNEFHSLSKDLFGLLSLEIPPDAAKAPPLWGSYSRSTWAVWRSSWTDDASGVWVRGRNPIDGHAHWDAGHVNFIAHGLPVLIEAGTSGYNDDLKEKYYDSLIGHNVLQIGDEILPPRKNSVPITVNRLDETGGDIVVEAGTSYPQATRWTRKVVWNASEMKVTDTVELREPSALQFRWHLASEQPLAITPGKTSAQAQLPAGIMKFPGWIGKLPERMDWTPPKEDIVPSPQVAISVEADQPIQVSQEQNFDHVVKFRDWRHKHATLVVRPAEPVRKLTVTTTFTVPAISETRQAGL